MIFKVETSRLKNIKVDVKSSLIDSMQYSQEQGLLQVKYKNEKFFKKKVREYQGVSQEQFFEILNSDSVGKAIIRLKKSMRLA